MDNRLVLFAKSESRCCKGREMLVRSRTGGFVTKNCCTCKQSAARVGLGQLPVVKCEICSRTMHSFVVNKNYSYKCSSCNHMFRLCDRIPRWEGLFEYCGVATPEGTF